MKCSGIYAIINTINGHCYIGSAIDITHRWDVHLHCLRHNKHHSPYLQNAWGKYGEKSFEFLTLFMCDPRELIRLEQELIDNLKPEYNCSPTAGSQLGMRRSPDVRRKISESLTGRKSAPFSTEHRARLSAARKGKSPSKEHRDNISKAKTGKPSGLLGIKRSAETREKISKSMKGKSPWSKGRSLSKEHRDKIRSTVKAHWDNLKSTSVSD